MDKRQDKHFPVSASNTVGSGQKKKQRMDKRADKHFPVSAPNTAGSGQKTAELILSLLHRPLAYTVQQVGQRNLWAPLLPSTRVTASAT